MRRTMTTFVLVLILALLAAPAAAGGGGVADAQPCRAFGDGQQLVMFDSCFEGTGHTVAAGSTLMVRNGGALPHTFTAVDGSFDTGILQPGERARLDLDEPGAVPVYCTLHATADGVGMAGLLVVEPQPQVALASAAASDERAGSWGWWLAAVLVSTVVAAVVTRRVVARSGAAHEPGAGADDEG